MKKLFILLIILFTLTGCSSGKSSSSYDYRAEDEGYYGDYDAINDMAGASAYAPSEAKTEQKTDSVSKVIVTGNMSAEITSLEDFVKPLSEAISKFGGYVQDSDTGKNYNGTRYYNATIRIPATQYQEFLDEISKNGNIASYSENRNDITDSYYDVQERIKNLEAEKAKVLEFYERAETIEELMMIEERLTDIQYEIDSKNTMIKNWNLLTSYSTLYIRVSETKVYTETPITFGERLVKAAKDGWNGFVEGCQDLAVWLVESFWSLLVLALCAYGLYRLIKWLATRPSAQERRAKNAAKKLEKEAAKKAKKDLNNPPMDNVIVKDDKVIDENVKDTEGKEVAPVTIDDVVEVFEEIKNGEGK